MEEPDGQSQSNEGLRPLVQQAHTTGRPVVLTRDGHDEAVLLPVGTFEALESSGERCELRQAVAEAEQDIAEGHWIEGSEVLAKLKRWATPSDRPSV